MPKFFDNALGVDFTGFSTVEAFGIDAKVTDAPNGVAGAIYISNGVMVSHITDADPLTWNGQRAEVTGFTEPYDNDRWYRYKFMIPAGWDMSKPMTIQQIHERPDSGDPQVRAVTWIVYVANDALKLLVPPASGLPENQLTPVSYWLCPIQTGVWYDCCLHAMWSKTNIGYREFFVDRRRVFGEYGIATNYDDVLGPYFKLGLYNHQHLTGWGERTVYYKDVTMWSANDGYSTVLGGDIRPADRMSYIGANHTA